MKEFKKGVFITFEGADGCGKTTQAELFKEYLDKKSIENILTLEPGGSELGQNLRQILLHYKRPVANTSETLLYLADRAQHVETIIRPAIKEGKIVLCDRYTDSTLAYQGYAREGDLGQIKYLNCIATSSLEPNLTIVYDVDSEIAQSRVGKTKDRLEAEGMEFHKKVRTGYLKIQELEPQRVKIIDANRTIDKVFEDTKRVIGEFLNL